MDKLARQLQEDAQRIEVSISDELDRRIDASLRAVTPELESPRPGPAARPPLFWWASTITGAAAAIAVIALVNWRAPDPPDLPPASVAAAIPSIDLKVEAAVLTGPLQEELDRLQSDLKKAEEKVRRDIGL
ncbi:MAG: hypothetical protein OEY37_08770 [Gammaproteobacteria bacterium]|nr:hypothetical protein [Gammaproteobacteria bacterium]MDH5617826.1 hypothetical protein [Gammaproteobacteria bacterium]